MERYAPPAHYLAIMRVAQACWSDHLGVAEEEPHTSNPLVTGALKARKTHMRARRSFAIRWPEGGCDVSTVQFRENMLLHTEGENVDYGHVDIGRTLEVTRLERSLDEKTSYLRC